MNNFAFTSIAFFLLLNLGHGQSSTPPFHKGVNLTNWFQESDIRTVQLYQYTPEVFAEIRSLGCDVIRLPINLHPMCGPAPAYEVPQLLYQFLDSVATWAEQADLQIIFDNHSFDPSVNTDPAVEQVLVKAWPQITQHFLNRAQHVHFEILNEPHGIAISTWNAIQGRVIESIRAVDTARSLIVGAANWNTYHDLESLPDYDDPFLIYTFHFYDPFLLSHQGATWVDPSMDQVRGIPFPYRSSDMPTMPGQYAGTWIEGLYNSYPVDGTEERVLELIDIAVAFQQDRDVPVFCGEFGVYQPFSDPADRINWYGIVRRKLEEHQIAWTVWDYHGGFGLFEASGQGLFDHDLNTPLLKELGLNEPPQSPFEVVPEESGFLIYDDFVGSGIEFNAYTSGGLLNLYGPNAFDGQFCVDWRNPGQYSHAGFNFRPDIDLTLLVERGASIEFAVKGGVSNTTFDIRFVDSKTDTEDHPWRIRYVCDDELFVRNGEWHQVSIPLSAFTEHGSWDNNTWYNPEGLFDWAAIDRFEIVAEYPETATGTFQFDNIQVTNGTSSTTYNYFGQGNVFAYPNPASSALTIETAIPVSGFIEVVNSKGIVISKVRCDMANLHQLDLTGLPPGTYIIHRVDGSGTSLGLIPFIKI